MLTSPQPELDIAAHVEMSKQARLLKHVANVALMHSTPDTRRAVLPDITGDDEFPLVGFSSPAMQRSSDVLPEPEGP